MSTKLHYGYADTPLGQVHYREAGSGPPAVFLHESPLSGATFEWALPLLASRVRAIAPDTPGYGASEPPPEPILLTGYADRIYRFLDTLGLKEVAIVGYHTGSAIGMQLAADHPELVKALVVVGSTLFNDEELSRWKQYLTNYFSLLPDGSHLTQMWGRYKTILGDNTPIEMTQFYVTEFLKGGPRYDWGFRAAFDFKADQVLPKITCPTYFVITEGDLLRYTNERSVALTPGAEGRILDSPIGQLPEGDPETFTLEVLSFLERIGYIPQI